ncbi:hypothetical protein MMC25_006699 [Agyrium rufum]|nr:hypothetical protein [Agyrium rufum]
MISDFDLLNQPIPQDDFAQSYTKDQASTWLLECQWLSDIVVDRAWTIAWNVFIANELGVVLDWRDMVVHLATKYEIVVNTLQLRAVNQ